MAAQAPSVLPVPALSRVRDRLAAADPAGAIVAAITVVGAVLRLWDFGRVGGNPFYDAAVRSMGLSWHNLWFGAFEPGAQVAIDKTPLDLWLQVAVVKVLGFGGVAVRVPEVLAGVAAIPLLYDLVRRLYGRTAGLGAAAALAVLPTAILTAHSDTMDSLMMLLDVAAAWLVVIGMESCSPWPVVAAGAVVGLAFNAKLFEALIVLPALVVLVVAALPRRRLVALAGGAAAMAAVGLSWIAAASLTPLGRRPWPIGSADGSIWNVVFAYNGTSRLNGSASAAALQLDPPGPLRFLSASGHDYRLTVGTSLVAAVVLGVTALGAALARRPRAPWPRRQIAGAAFFGTWLVLGVALLSHMQRLQPRYLEAVTPAIAAVIGIGVATLAARRRLLAAAVGVTLVVSVALEHPPWWALAAGLGAAVAVALWGWRGDRARVAGLATLALVAVLAVPAAGAVTVAREHQSDAGLPARLTSGQVARLSAFLLAHQDGARYETASSSVDKAAPLIVHDGRPVLMLTSQAGRPLLTPAQLQRLVAQGAVRYGLLGRGACATAAPSRCAPVVLWAVHHAHDVSAAAGLPPQTLAALGP